MKIKICGIRRKEDVDLINRYKPDYAGFIFYPPSFRYITKKEAKTLKDRIDPKIKCVGVFVDERPELIKDYYDSGIFELVQLHGNEDYDYINDLKAYGIPVIKSLRITDKDSFSKVTNLDPDYFLFDVFSKKVVGGSGESFNWDLLDNITVSKPYFLAGGISQENIKEAMKTDAFALDLSSGVETDGIKDKEKLERVMKIFRYEV